MRRWQVAVLLAALAALGGCFESDEERAARAYMERDYATAQRLAHALAEADNAHGADLLALMAAQGMGQQVDYAQALAHADRARALDAAYASTRALVLERMTANMATAEASFARGDYARALSLAEPLAAFGHASGAQLLNTLITGHYVALPGSEMSWRDFWSQCSGSERGEDNQAADAAFAASCAGRRVVWDGHVIRSDGATIAIKMRPGRRASRNDLILRLAAPGDAATVVNATKIRFAGIIEARGNANRPDVLGEARVVGAAPLSAAEEAQQRRAAKHQVIRACQTLAKDRYGAEHLPQWAIDVKEEIRARRIWHRAAFGLMLRIDSTPDAFVPRPDGGWHAVFDGHVTLHSSIAGITEVYAYTAECTIGACQAAADCGSLSFLSVSGPK